jgi:hypothetical protein
LGNWNVIWKRGATTMRALTIVLAKQVVLTEKTSSNIKKRRQTTECHLSSHTILRSVIYRTSCKIFKEPPVLAFRKPKFERYLGESWHLPSICLQWSMSKMWFETMYDVQKHPMHTQI